MITYSSGFETCKHCDGLGFLRTGDFADRKFIKCTYCLGLGQKYLDPAPAKRGMDGKVIV